MKNGSWSHSFVPPMFTAFYRRTVLLAACAVFVVGSLGCSALSHTAPSPELQAILVNISARYLNAVALGDAKQIAILVLWPEYEVRGHNKLSRADAEAVLAQIRERNWPPQDNPIYNLRDEEVSVDEDSASVFYLKTTKSGSDVRIKIKLAWSGNAWLVVDDNVFGEEGYITQAMRTDH